ncbi:hypothetical protein DV738_g4128, partial [Chaetothyriales sp. CBS 135597]
MTANDSAGPRTTPAASWLSLPAPVRQLFDRFPLTTPAPNRLPQRSPRDRSKHVLYIFPDPWNNSAEAPSCNPSCLKWQAFLQFRGIRPLLRPSNNHASPSGALPFLVPASSGDGELPKAPVTASKLPAWIISQGGPEEEEKGRGDTREDVYTALIDSDVRSAWLYNLYIDSDNFRAVSWPLYVATVSRSRAVQHATANQLRNAAFDELAKTSPIVDGTALYEAADEAFKALSTLLGTSDSFFFFNAAEPGLFDASLFAYTHLLLEFEPRWASLQLVNILKKYDNLVAHRDRLLRQYFS